jgi:hypothetical protein
LQVELDGEKIGAIRSGGREMFDVPDGRHQLMVRLVGLDGVASSLLTVYLLTGQNTEVVCSLRAGLLSPTILLRLKSQALDEAEYRISTQEVRHKTILFDLLLIGFLSLLWSIAALVDNIGRPSGELTIGHFGQFVFTAFIALFLFGFLYGTYMYVVSAARHWLMKQGEDVSETAIQALGSTWHSIGWRWIFWWPIFGWFVWYILWDLWRKYLTKRIVKKPIDTFWLQP